MKKITFTGQFSSIYSVFYKENPIIHQCHVIIKSNQLLKNQKDSRIGVGPVTPVNLSPLEEIIHKVNEKFGSKVSEKDEKVISYLYEKLTTNEELIELAKNILFDSFEQSYFTKFYTHAAVEGYQKNKEMFEDFLHNTQMFEWTKQHLCTRIYKQFHAVA